MKLFNFLKSKNKVILKDENAYENQDIQTGQALASIVNVMNTARQNTYNETMSSIISQRLKDTSKQAQNFSKALGCMAEIEKFIRNPENILGRPSTKHGEIAEMMDVGLTNAKKLVSGGKISHTFKGIGRFAPEDYKINGVNIQSKFLNGANKTVKAILGHLDDHNTFANQGGKYVIPKDQYNDIIEIMNGTYKGELSLRSQNAIKANADQLEKQTGKLFSKLVKPSELDYGEVQSGRVEQTLNSKKNEISKINDERNNEINKQAQEKENTATQQSKASFGEGLKAAAYAGALEAGMQTAIAMFKKKKSLAKYTEQDWKDVGKVFGEGAINGSIKGAAIYTLSNYASMSAPLAGAYVSAISGMSSLYLSYKNGEISGEELVDQSQIICFDTAVSYVGGTIGQVLIPIPILGVIIGSISASVASSILKEHINKHEQELIELSRKKFTEYIQMLDNELYEYVTELYERMNVLWLLSRDAFDPKVNSKIRLQASVKLAWAHGVEEHKIIKSREEGRSYFMG